MSNGLAGKTALVTGSTAGIGLAIAAALRDDGARVIVNGRTAARVDAAVAALGGAARGITGIAADLATTAGREALYAAVERVDVLINNLGVYAAAALDDVTEDDYVKFFNVNVVSSAALSKHYLRGMRAQGWGRIVMIASETGVNVPPDMIPYGVSKAAQIALGRGLAETTAGTAITVNTVLPGPTKSEGIKSFLTGVDELAFIQQLRPTSLIRRFAEPEEVAALVAYLAGPKASATNGAAIRVEGGLLRGVL